MAPALTVRGLRGATTVDADTVAQVTERSQELMREIMARNELVEDDIISVLFTATADVTSTFPATAIREIGFGAVPLLCAAEIAVPGSMPKCIRVLLHVSTTREPATRCITSISTAPKGSAMTSPTEGGTRRRALVVGTGLIGGSIALGLRRRGWHVSGIDVDEGRARAALEQEVVDAIGDDLEAEVVFVATPATSAAQVGPWPPGRRAAAPRRRGHRRQRREDRPSSPRPTTHASSGATPWRAPSRSDCTAPTPTSSTARSGC